MKVWLKSEAESELFDRAFYTWLPTMPLFFPAESSSVSSGDTP